MIRTFAVRSLAAFGLMVALHASSSHAQVIYEPVRYQYGPQPCYYYGGSDPRVFDRAERTRALDLRINRYGLNGRAVIRRNSFGGRFPFVYSDAVPYANASIYGYSATDARNDAYLKVPRYYRMRDLLRAAVPVGRGLYVVPAQTRPIPPLPGEDEDDENGAAEREPEARRIIIIPKRPANRPARTPGAVAAAR